MPSAIPERVLPRPALSIAQLTKKYVVHGGYEVPALRGVSLDLYPGEMVGLFGSNGAGKTTLVRIVAGLLSADSGDVAWGSPEGRSCLGYVSQKGGLQYGLTCREEMTFHAQCFGQSARQARSSVDAVAAMLNCGYLMDWDVGRLSGGQKRVVEVGLALVGHPSVVLLDEPTLGLDPATRLSLWQTVQSARRETGAAFLVTTHYIDEVADHLSDVSVMNHGSVVATGSPATICEQYAVGEATVTVAGDSSERAVSVLAGTFPAVARDGNRIRIPSKHPNSDAALVSQTLTRNAVEMSSISIREASLEEAFLAITVTSGKEQLS